MNMYAFRPAYILGIYLLLLHLFSVISMTHTHGPQKQSPQLKTDTVPRAPNELSIDKRYDHRFPSRELKS